MFLKEIFLCLIGLSAGGVIAAGVFAFLVMIGIFPRLIGFTRTNKHILLYETCIILGGILGNIFDIYKFPIGYGGNLVLGIYGISVGVFIGCLVMSLAETLKALPIFSRRIHLGVGLQYIILSIAMGKLLGSLVFFAERFGQ
ncbi:stage V sporulation protein AB [Lacrimispora sp.]|uniref:stage V sporulation protein AB n=1 Tax=Lacrimispora sp. TaxID=2719234 RepID=UPI0028AE0DCF|nr:stage V sporulation protein AB [Lacrimispora sp.]